MDGGFVAGPRAYPEIHIALEHDEPLLPQVDVEIGAIIGAGNHHDLELWGDQRELARMWERTTHWSYIAVV